MTMINDSKQDSPDTVQSSSIRILLHTPDITLKGKNRSDFENALVTNIKRRLKHFALPWQVVSGKGRINIRPQAQTAKQLDIVVQAMQRTAGISSLSICQFLSYKALVNQENEFNWSLLEETILPMAQECYKQDASFAIRVNRTFKELPVRSVEIGTRLGDFIRNKTAWDKVKLKNPDQTFYIDIYPDGFYLYGICFPSAIDLRIKMPSQGIEPGSSV